MNKTPMTPGAALKALRIEARWTLEQTAKSAGVSAAQLSRVENDVKTASPAWLSAVARALAGALAQR